MIFILLALATWRVSHILVYEDGPYDVFSKLRESLDHTMLFKLINCLKCVSVWVGAAFSLITATNIIWFVLYTFALSAAAIIIDEIVGKLER